MDLESREDLNSEVERGQKLFEAIAEHAYTMGVSEIGQSVEIDDKIFRIRINLVSADCRSTPPPPIATPKYLGDGDFLTMDLREAEPEVKISRILKTLPQRIKNAIAVLLGKADIAPPLYRLTVPDRGTIDEINAAISRAVKAGGLTISTAETVSPCVAAPPERIDQSPD